MKKTVLTLGLGVVLYFIYSAYKDGNSEWVMYSIFLIIFMIGVLLFNQIDLNKKSDDLYNLIFLKLISDVKPDVNKKENSN